MAKRKKKKKSLPNLKTWLIPKLRNASRIWPAKKEAREKAKEKVQDGFFKNGNPKYRVKYRCNSCEELFDKSDTQMDHIRPVVPTKGFTNWDDYILSLFVSPEGYQCLCSQCHNIKTQKENKTRRKSKKRAKKA